MFVGTGNEINTSGLSVGSHTAQVSVTDGNLTTIASRQFDVIADPPNPPPSVTITSPGTHTAGDTAGDFRGPPVRLPILPPSQRRIDTAPDPDHSRRQLVLESRPASRSRELHRHWCRSHRSTSRRRATQRQASCFVVIARVIEMPPRRRLLDFIDRDVPYRLPLTQPLDERVDPREVDRWLLGREPLPHLAGEVAER